MVKKGIIFLFVLILGMNFISAASTWSFGDLITQLDEMELFYYIVPFLLVFALIFGILEKTTFIDNKAVKAILAACIGIIAAITPVFPEFLRKLAPNIAVGVSVLLAAIIFLGLFYDSQDNARKGIIWVLFGIGAIIFVFAIADTFSGYSGVGYNIWGDYGPALITALILGVLIWAVVKGTGSSGGSAAGKPAKT